jgi:hypothetical protein
VLVLVAGACTRHEAPPVGVPVEGGNMPALPPLAPQDAKLESAALEAAAIIARDAGSDALLIARNGHLLLERYWHDTAFATPVAAGDWQGVIDDLLVGALVNDRKLIDTEALPSREAIEQAAGSDLATYLSKRLWRPIGAADAMLAPDLLAAQGDWIRIGEILANEGVYQGEEIVPPGWVQRLLARRAVRVDAAGATPDRDAYRLPGAGDSCLWIVPTLRLIVLRTGRQAGADRASPDATILDAVMRGVIDRPRAAHADGDEPDPSIFVPAH